MPWSSLGTAASRRREARAERCSAEARARLEPGGAPLGRVACEAESDRGGPLTAPRPRARRRRPGTRFWEPKRARQASLGPRDGVRLAGDGNGLRGRHGTQQRGDGLAEGRRVPTSEGGLPDTLEGA
eukprot:8127405-Alexandrium_andersonii.AAC.1